MQRAEPDVDVLIVGAGPVGLFLANECARRLLRWRIVEQNAGQSEHSKALAIFPRTLEIFDMAGLIDPIAELANRVTCVTVISHRRALARIEFRPAQSPYPFVAMVPQDVTERLLVEALRRRGGAVEYQTALVALAQDADSVLATIQRGVERSQVRASYVVGCDGAHSTVRHLLNFPFTGAQYRELFMLADVQTNETLASDEMQLCPHEAGPLAIFPMSATRRRVVATVKDAEGPEPSLDLARRLLAERAPTGIEARELHWGSYFRIHHRRVARLRNGRIFIAGDAAHVHSPFGGQGMNTGLQDVWNLVWKLDLAADGRASKTLLDSYTDERLPVIERVIEVTDVITKAMGTPSRFAQTARDVVIPIVSRMAPFQHGFVQTLSELGIAYRGSPIVEGAGERYLDDSMRGGGVGRQFLLVIGSESDTFGDKVAEVVRKYDGLLELRRTNAGGLRLVRPDGYVAYAAGGESMAALEAVDALLNRVSGRS
jgi:2-polyprenyl-6-methoxyphenol hydroxylase-like FAD-dependent oxidoreductase